jgi:two-component system, OmpR family, sensor kinase
VVRLRGVSVRTRITLAVALLTAVAMTATGLVVYSLESSHIDVEVRNQIEQEIAEFEELEKGNDPETARPFTSVEALIRLYLQRNVPDDDEVLVGYWDGRVQVASDSRHPEFTEPPDPELLAVIEQRLDRGGSQRIGTEFGEVIVTVVPARNSQTSGAMVIANFLADEHTELNRIIQTYAIVCLLLFGLITATAFGQAGRLLSPIRTLRTTAQEITETDLSRRIPASGNDDITALTRTLNAMLSRLDRAFTGQRQFLDDAGHELKTPLTVLRGHLELLDSADPEDVDATRALLLEEIDRMSRLVNEMIVLAKADRPDYFRVGPVQLTPYLETVLVKCRALGPRDWRIDETADAVADLDEQRVTQALLQLAQNAVKHTEDGAEIALGARATGTFVELWVRDTGPGVRDQDKDRIFQRFDRGSVEPERPHDTDTGFGLGLSIVSAIARGHGGRVAVADAPGGGAVFTLRLPLRREGGTWPGS